MGDFLVTEMEIEHTVPQNYWWPIFFEAMHRASLQYQHPQSASKQGRYFSPEIGQIEYTFQELWDLLYQDPDGYGDCLVSMWPSQKMEAPFEIQMALEKAVTGYWKMVTSLSDGYLMKASPEQKQRRIGAFLRFCLECYDLCRPHSVRMYWDEDYTPLMHIQSSSQTEPLPPVLFQQKLLQWKKVFEKPPYSLLIVDPLPVHSWGRNFDFVPLAIVL